MGYQREALKGFSWMGLLRGSTRAIAFLKLAILARILTPVEFGIFGIASLALSFLEVLTESGINAFLIQEDVDSDEYIDTAWTVSIIRGGIISLFLFLLAKPISMFFNSPDALKILFLISIVPFMRGFINPSIVGFQKRLEFNKEFTIRFFVFTVDAIASVVLAVIYKTPDALVIGLLIGILMELLVSHIFITPRPRLSFEGQRFVKVIKRGVWLTLNGIFNFLFQQGDDAIVGKLLGTYSLGIYQNAYKISTLPVSEVGQVFHSVSFPVFVKIREDKKRLFRAFLLVTFLVCLFALPFGGILYFFPEEIVLLILGKNWIETVPVVRILAIYGVLRAITSMVAPVFLAVKKQRYIATITFASLLVMVLSIFPLVAKHGIVGASISVLLGWIAVTPLIIFLIYKIFR